jgi:ribonucleoside-diphosphate reductase alpha chain
MGATHAEKSTVQSGSLNAVSSQGGSTTMAAADDTPASDIKFCSIDNPDCEACQ